MLQMFTFTTNEWIRNELVYLTKTLDWNKNEVVISKFKNY